MTTRVTIVSVGDATEGLALRAMLETMDYEARLLRARSAAEVTDHLLAGSSDMVTILSAQGSAAGLYLGPSLDGGYLAMTAAFADVSFDDDAVLFSTAPATRESGLVQVMLNAGGHLVAPNGTPDRGIIVPWIGACLLGAQSGLAAAVASANSLVAPENRFSYG